MEQGNAEPATFLTRSAFARLMGVSPAAVTQWNHAGRIKITDGKVDVVASRELLAKSGGAARGGAHRNGMPGGAGDAKADDVYNGRPPAAGTLLSARTALAAAQARKVETDQLLRTGVLVERAAYAKALRDALGPIFASMASVSATRGPDLAAETDVRKVQIMIDDAMDAIRRDIAATLQKLIDGPAGSS